MASKAIMFVLAALPFSTLVANGQVPTTAAPTSVLQATSDAQAPERTQSRPNVVVVLTDDQGWGDLSLSGNSNIATPNLDALGRSGVRFNRFFVSPVCSPTRAEFLTGRYHPRGGVFDTSKGGERLDLDERTIAELFHASGYRSAAFGKWHNGMQYPYHPLARGFESFYGYCSGHWGHYFSPQLERNGELVKGDGYLVDDFTDKAIRFVEENQQEPFFLYLALPTPHAPMQVPDKYWDRVKDRPIRLRATDRKREDEQFTRAALAMVECIDDNVGRLRSAIRSLGLEKDTIFVFFCDNGPNSHRWAGGMKGKKGSTDEGGVRSPLFVSWPGKIRSGHLVAQISSVTDLLPTLCDYANVPTVGTRPLDGMSLRPLIDGTKSAFPGRIIMSHWNGRVSARNQHYRLDHQGKLYDMLADPSQTRDVAKKNRDVHTELTEAVRIWKKEVLEPNLGKQRRFPIGHLDFGLTQLPARDAKFSDSIQRSASAPNCSYLKSWTQDDQQITWDVEVLTSGNYEVEMLYACSDALVGVEVSAEFGQAKATARIETAHTPPAVGPQFDRVPRVTQSPMKDFASLRLGTLALEAGQGVLKLSGRGFPLKSAPIASRSAEGGIATASGNLPEMATDGLEMRLLMLRRVP